MSFFIIKRLHLICRQALLPCLGVVLFLQTISAHGQKNTDSTEVSTFITSFPFTILSGGVIIVDARLDSFPDSLHFILDTGSGGISLDSSLVDYFKLPKVPSERTLKGIANVRRITYVKDRTLHLPNLAVEHLDFHLNDYDLLTSTYGIRIDGIIGYSFLKQFIVKVNYDFNVIEVWEKGKIRYPKRGFLLQPKIEGIPIFTASVEDGRGSTTKFFFDTGAGLSLLLSEDFAQDSSILRVGKKSIITQAEGLGGKKKMRLTTIKQMKLGPFTFKKVPTHIFEDDTHVTAYPALGGLIGNDLLRRFNLTINYEKNEIFLKPNSHFKDNFDYSYTGLGIYLYNNQIVIEDVLPGSPGEVAGLKPGDVILAIDNVFNGTIQSYKDALQQIGSRVKVVVVRDGAPVIFWIKVKSFLKETS